MTQFVDEDEGWGGRTDLRPMLQALRRRRVAFLVVLGLMAVPALILPFQIPVSYQAVATVSIQGTPEVMEFGKDFMPSALTRQPLAPAMALITSDRVLGRVADQLSHPPERQETLWGRAREMLGFGSEDAAFSAEAIRQQRIAGLRRSLSLTSAGGGTVLEVAIATGDRVGAAFLANAISDAYVQHEIDRREVASRRTLGWLRARAASLRDQIERRDEAMVLIQARSGAILGSGSPKQGELRASLTRELQTAKLDLLTIQQRLAELPSRSRVLRRAAQDVERQAARARYRALEQELALTRLRYTETHPEVERLTAVLAELSSELGSAATQVSNPLEQARVQKYAELEEQEARLDVRIGALNQALADVAETTGPDADAAAEYERLDREAAIDRSMLQVLLQRSTSMLMSGASEAAAAAVLDYAVPPAATNSTRRLLALLIGIGIAFAAGIGTVAVLEVLDRRLYDPADIAKTLGVPQLGSIPMVHSDEPAELQSSLSRTTAAGEGYRNLRTALMFSTSTSKLRTLLVTSAVSGEGKTTVSINLATSFALVGRKVLLIDADMRRPRVHRVLGLEAAPGLADVLSGDIRYPEAIRRSEGFKPDVITSGEMPGNPSELVGSAQLDLVLARVAHEYDLVIMDSPILLAVSDALQLAGRVDGVLLVSKPGSVESRAFEGIRSDLSRVNATVVGVVSNQVDATDPYQYPSYLYSPYVKAPERRRVWRRKNPASSGRRT